MKNSADRGSRRVLSTEARGRRQRWIISTHPLMTGHKGNSKFCFPETLNVPRGEAEGNIDVEGKQLTVSRRASH